MDNSAMVRFFSVFVQECAFVMFVYFNTGVCSFHLYSNMPDLALIYNKVATEGECASWFRMYVNSTRCDSFDPII